MSAINGDKARFNKDRKSKIARRARNRKTFGDIKTQAPSKASGTKAKVSA
jgi:hypothetical protein